MSSKIYISYRRDDASAWAGRLYEFLLKHFSRKEIFMGVDSIEMGLDFVKTFEEVVGSCDVLITIIGAHWLTCTDGQGERRLDNPEDFARMEIASALRRNIRVIPVLVDGASMPRSVDLPDDLATFASRVALQLSHDGFRIDSKQFVKVLKRALVKATR
jgi:hypothetical protein